MPTKTKTLPPIHPGETLREDFLKPLGLSVNRLATELFVPATRISDIVRCRRAITAGTALRLARYFGTTPQFWMNLQSNYDLELAQDVRGSEISVSFRLACITASRRQKIWLTPSRDDPGSTTASIPAGWQRPRSHAGATPPGTRTSSRR
jgi:addiction module HigA family antidote